MKTDLETAGLVRRLLAMSYDLMLVVAVIMIGSLLFLVLTGGEVVEGSMRIVFQVYLLLLTVGFFGFFWIRGGQTLGMRAWRLQLIRPDGGRIDTLLVVRRLAAGIVTLGPLGLITVPFHPRGLSLTDMLAGTLIRQQPKPD